MQPLKQVPPNTVTATPSGVARIPHLPNAVVISSVPTDPTTHPPTIAVALAEARERLERAERDAAGADARLAAAKVQLEKSMAEENAAMAAHDGNERMRAHWRTNQFASQIREQERVLTVREQARARVAECEALAAKYPVVSTPIAIEKPGGTLTGAIANASGFATAAEHAQAMFLGSVPREVRATLEGDAGALATCLGLVARGDVSRAIGAAFTAHERATKTKEVR